MDEKQQLKLQLGRRAAYLRRCVEVSELIGKYENETTIRKRVFALHIQPIIRKSYVTFNTMLNEPNPQRQLEEIERQLQDLQTL
jgi:hypothetical protein